MVGRPPSLQRPDTRFPYPTTFRSADGADAGAGYEEDSQDHAARHADRPGDGDSPALVLHQHDLAGNDVERGDDDDQRQDQEHDVALDLERGEETRIDTLPDRKSTRLNSSH